MLSYLILQTTIQIDERIVWGGAVFSVLFMLLVIAVYIDSLHWLYYRRVNFKIGDIEVMENNSSMFF